ncbi:hypothetical protein C0995_000228 [Termitomyces sp. Mi166|nr:hypothetical protein C0995_000228 [Termitomyces sp. Mi166\
MSSAESSNSLLPNAGIPGPLPDDFDFDEHIVIPEGFPRFELPLAVRVQQNLQIENFNNESILRTVTVKSAPTPRAPDLDVSPPLRALYFYSDDELNELVESEALCDALSPLPPSFLHQIVATQARSKREAEVA